MPIDLMQETVIRWSDPEPGHVPLLKEGGITAAVAPSHEGFERACRDAGIQAVPAEQLQSVGLSEAGKAGAGGVTVVKAGVWPGTGNPDPSVASATRSLWIDQNCHLAGYLRALYSRVQPVLGYLPDVEAGVQTGRVLRFDSLELALAEAWAAGGNYVMAIDRRFREALLGGNPEALTAWRRLGTTGRWLRAHRMLFRQPALPGITVLVDHNDSSLEIANLCCRHNVSPAIASATDPPAPEPARLVVSAAGVDAPQGDARRRILAHAEAGATVVADDSSEKAWWRTSGIRPIGGNPDRKLYALGRGRLAVYDQPVEDPGEFALDLIDLVTQQRRPARLWNCTAGLALATQGPVAGPVTGQAALHVLNYGQPVTFPVLARVEGVFSRATLLRPESEPVTLKVSRRGTGSEVAIPQLRRVASVVFR